MAIVLAVFCVRFSWTVLSTLGKFIYKAGWPVEYILSKEGHWKVNINKIALFLFQAISLAYFKGWGFDGAF